MAEGSEPQDQEPKKKPERARYWCFTINNYERLEEVAPGEFVSNDDQIVLRTLCPRDVRYLVWGREVGENGTPHLQGFVSMYGAVQMTWLKTRGFARAHLAPAKGSLQVAIDYCKKDGDFEEFGEFVTQGTRTDLWDFKRRIEKDEIPVEIAEDPAHFTTYIKFHNGLEKYSHHHQAKRIRVDRRMPKVYIRIGDSGSGKTRWLDDEFGLDGWARMPNPTGNWWITPTVSRARTVLIDDVGPAKVPKVEEFLEWTDRYPLEFNSKGGHLWWKPENIVFTSNVHYLGWWKNLTDHHKVAVERRIYRIDLVYKDQEEIHTYPQTLEPHGLPDE